MNIFRYFYALFIITVVINLNACTTSPGRYSDTSKTIDENKFNSLIGTLRPQRIDKSDCGLFLWDKTQSRNLIFFASALNSDAKMVIAEEEVDLKRKTAEGNNVLGHFMQQTYVSSSFNVSLSFVTEPSGNNRNGAIIPQGTLRFQQNEGWDLVIPVAGIVSCKTY